MQKQDIDILRIEVFAKSIDSRARILHLASVVLRHQPVAVAWYAFQRYRQHLWHAMIAVGGFEKPDSAIVSMTNEAGKILLSKIALYLAAVSSGSKGKPSYFNIRLT